mmetsp:Transcript_161/g.626  ORF Transcript_161/g.626 Transcript_161/m.626 type:complete len:239 (+) Transcript_161:60-776(+)
MSGSTESADLCVNHIPPGVSQSGRSTASGVAFLEAEEARRRPRHMRLRAKAVGGEQVEDGKREEGARHAVGPGVLDEAHPARVAHGPDPEHVVLVPLGLLEGQGSRRHPCTHGPKVSGPRLLIHWRAHRLYDRIGVTSSHHHALGSEQVGLRSSLRVDLVQEDVLRERRVLRDLPRGRGVYVVAPLHEVRHHGDERATLSPTGHREELACKRAVDGDVRLCGWVVVELQIGPRDKVAL